MCISTYTRYTGCHHIYKLTKPCASINLCLTIGRGARGINDIRPSHCHACLSRESNFAGKVSWKGIPQLNFRDDNSGLGDPLPKKYSRLALKTSERHGSVPEKQVRFKGVVDCTVIEGTEQGHSTWFHPEDILSGDSSCTPGNRLKLKLNERSSSLKMLEHYYAPARKARKSLTKPLQDATSPNVLEPIYDTLALLEQQFSGLQKPLEAAKKAHNKLAQSASSKRPQPLDHVPPFVYVPPPLLEGLNKQESWVTRVAEFRNDFERYTYQLIKYRNETLDGYVQAGTPDYAALQTTIQRIQADSETPARIFAGAAITGMAPPDWDWDSESNDWNEQRIRRSLGKRAQATLLSSEQSAGKMPGSSAPSRRPRRQVGQYVSLPPIESYPSSTMPPVARNAQRLRTPGRTHVVDIASDEPVLQQPGINDWGSPIRSLRNFCRKIFCLNGTEVIDSHDR